MTPAWFRWAASLRSGQTFLVPFQLIASVIPRLTSGFNYDVAAGEVRIFNTAARRGVESPAPSGPAMSGGAVASSPPRARRNVKRLVVVDAGHGGVDNGMSGPIGAGPGCEITSRLCAM